MRASSTDGLAVTEAIEATGARVLMLGAGGAARAVATALMEAGAVSVGVYARRPDASKQLVVHLRSTFPGAEIEGLARPDDQNATMIVNATPLKDELPAEPRRHQQIVDLAYRPDGVPTAFVAAARKAGCAVVVDGLEVLLRQGAASFERWTGVPAPVDAMRASLEP